MKSKRRQFKIYFAIIFGLSTIAAGCSQNSEIIADKTAGLNGSFEVSQNGLPVNWRMYTPKTVPDADFIIMLDKGTFKDGGQSLKFEVKKCSATGGWKSPGFTNEFFEIGKYEGEGRYKISFWVINNGTNFRFLAGGVAAQKGDMKVLVEENDNIKEWKHFEYEIDVPKDRWLRIELNILQPGEFWIDNIKIEKI